MNKQEMIEFEDKIAKLWEEAKIPFPTHLCGGNEEQLIEIFKDIKPEDYVFSTHRNHYHYLLKSNNPERLEKLILQGDSMHVYDKDCNFLTTAIVAGGPCIAAGIAYALKLKQSDRKVWCFVGDGAEDEGHFYEAVRYVEGHDLPCTFIIEDNNRSVETPKLARYGKSEMQWPSCVIKYSYKPTRPHVGTGNWVDFGTGKSGGSSF